MWEPSCFVPFQVIFNKYLITNWNFHFPFFLTCWHCLVSTILTQVLHRTTDYLPGVSLGKVSWRTYLTTIVPVSLFFAVGICLANMAYQYISVAYIQMIKAVNPVPLLLLYIAFGMEKPSFVLLVAVCIISFGVYISSMGELRFSWIGFAVQVGRIPFHCSPAALLFSFAAPCPSASGCQYTYDRVICGLLLRCSPLCHAHRWAQ